MVQPTEYRHADTNAHLVPSQESETENYNGGHRDRLRDRFCASPSSLSNYELLELLLFSSIPRRDTKPIAKKLLSHHRNNLGFLLAASPESLKNLKIEYFKETSINLLLVVREMMLRIQREKIIQQDIISSWQDVVEYFRLRMTYQKIETLRVLFLNSKNRIIDEYEVSKGTVNETPAYPREIITTALEKKATALVIVHNHPSGDPHPSSADIAFTKNLAQSAAPLDILLHDHVIIGHDQHFSFRSEGLL